MAKKNLSDECVILQNVIQKYEMILEGICNDFSQQKATHLLEVEKLIEDAETEIKGGNAASLNEMESIRLNLKKISCSIQSKITRRVLFSKWAVIEMNMLISNARECLDKLGKYVVTGDGETVNWLKSRSDRCLDLCQEYIKNHKDRMGKGTCLMESSTIYQHILTSFQEIFKSFKTYAETTKNNNG